MCDDEQIKYYIIIYSFGHVLKTTLGVILPGCYDLGLKWQSEIDVIIYGNYRFNNIGEGRER